MMMMMMMTENIKGILKGLKEKLPIYSNFLSINSELFPFILGYSLIFYSAWPRKYYNIILND